MARHLARCDLVEGRVDVRDAPTSWHCSSMKLSTRNQLQATVTEVRVGEVMAAVKVALPDGQVITASITREAVEDLALATGDAVTVLVKSTEVMLGKD